MKAKETSIGELQELGFKEVLTGKRKRAPHVSISEKGSYFNGATAREINAEYALILYNSEKRKLLLIPATADDMNAISFGAKPTAKEKGVVTTVRNLVMMLKRDGWDFNTNRYLVSGEYVDSLGGVLFDLNDATTRAKHKRRVK